MIRKLQVLIGGVLFASGMMLAGCVAPAGDDVALDEAAAALVAEEASDGVPAAPRVLEEEEVVAGVLDSIDDGTTDPQPNPWVPTAAGAVAPPIGPTDPGPYMNNSR